MKVEVESEYNLSITSLYLIVVIHVITIPYLIYYFVGDNSVWLNIAVFYSLSALAGFLNDLFLIKKWKKIYSLFLNILPLYFIVIFLFSIFIVNKVNI